MIGPRLWCAAFMLVAGLSVAAEAPTPAETSALAQGFWAGIAQLGLIFKAVGSLGGGVDRGQIWIVDLATGEQRRIAGADALAWPVLGPDRSTIFALRGGQLVRLPLRGGDIVLVGSEAAWRKLVGVDAENKVLGFVAGRPRVQPAVMTSKGELRLLPQPETDEERERVSFLLQENRAYADGRQLIVRRSTRGGRGYDISLVSDGAERNLSDCGDDACGQPSLSPDGRYVLYVRATTP